MKRIKNFRFFFIAGTMAALVLIMGCGGPAPVEKKKWEYVGFLPSTDGQIVSEASTESRDSLICRDKSTVLARDNMDILILKILKSFHLEWQKDRIFENHRKYFENFVIRAEYLAEQKVEILNISVDEKRNMFHCKADVGLKIFNLLNVINQVAAKDTLFFADMKKTRFYRKIVNEARKLRDPAKSESKRRPVFRKSAKDSLKSDSSAVTPSKTKKTETDLKASDSTKRVQDKNTETPKDSEKIDSLKTGFKPVEKSGKKINKQDP